MSVPSKIALLIGLALAACRSPGARPVPSEEASPADAPTEARPYRVTFAGNSTLSNAKLRDVIRIGLDDYESGGYREAYIDDAAFDISIAYKKRGFAFVDVRYAVDATSHDVRFEIAEGPRPTIVNVEFEGMRELGIEDFYSRLDSPRSELFGTGPPYYVEQDVRAALSAMELAYVELGFLQARVDVRPTRFSEERTRAEVHVTVSEGARFLTGSAEISTTDTPPETLAQLRSILLEATGGESQLYRPRLPYELRGKLLEELGNRGHVDAAVRLKRTVDEAAGLVHLQFEVLSGPRIRVGDIRFAEGVTTRRTFLLSRISLEPGDLFDNREQRASIQRLYETGLFREVRIEPVGDGDTRDLLVELVEAPSIEVFLEPGYGSYERLRLRAGFREKNLWGTGRLFRAETTVGELDQRVTFGITDPWFLETRLAADLSTQYNRRVFPSFTNTDIGIGVFWTRDWNAEQTTSFGYQYRRSLVSDVDVVDDEVLAALEDINISSVRATHRRDTRDNFFVPQRGTNTEVTLEVGDESIGSELNFIRAIFQVAAYRQLARGTVVAAAYRTGAIRPINGQDEIPLQERFFNGGENAVRSFRETELGPKDVQGNPIGGEAYATLSLELRQDLWGKFQGALFVDAGNVTPDYGDYFDFAGIEYGVGAGLRYLLPLGPVRLDLAHNPNASESEDDWILHVSIGMAF